MTRHMNMTKRVLVTIMAGLLVFAPVTAFAQTAESPASTVLNQKGKADNKKQNAKLSYEEFTDIRSDAEKTVKSSIEIYGDYIDELDSVIVETDFQEEMDGCSYVWTDEIDVQASIKSQYANLVPFLSKNDIYSILKGSYDGIEAYADSYLETNDPDYYALYMNGAVAGKGFKGTIERDMQITLKCGKNTYMYDGTENGYYLNDKWVKVNQ